MGIHFMRKPKATSLYETEISLQLWLVHRFTTTSRSQQNITGWVSSNTWNSSDLQNRFQQLWYLKKSAAHAMVDLHVNSLFVEEIVMTICMWQESCLPLLRMQRFCIMAQTTKRGNGLLARWKEMGKGAVLNLSVHFCCQETVRESCRVCNELRWSDSNAYNARKLKEDALQSLSSCNCSLGHVSQAQVT